MSPLRHVVAALGLATAVTLAGCGGGDPPSGPTPGIQVTVNPSSLSVEQGASGTVSISLTRAGGFAGAVTATVEGLPAGVTVTVSPSTLTTTTTSAVVTVAVAASVAPGSYTATVKGTASGVGEATTTYSLTVTALPDFALTANPGNVTIPAGLSGTSAIAIARTNFPGAVALSLLNPPAGITGTFNPAGATTNTSDLTINVAKTVAPGPQTLTVQGTATGPGSKTTTIALTVTPEPSYTLSMAPTSLQVLAGTNQTATVNITRTNFTGPVTLALDNPPAGITAAFNQPAPTGTTSTMTVTVAATVTPGVHTLTIKGTATGVPSVRGEGAGPQAVAGDRTVTFTVMVVSATVSVAPGSLTVTQGQSGQVAVTVTRAAGFTGPVTFTVDGRPAPARMAFGPNPATGTTSTLTIDAQGSTVGTYQIAVHGLTGPSAHATATFDLTIAAPAGTTVDYRFCSNAPSWLARRDGNGAWLQVAPVLSGNVTTFSFPLASDLGEIAYTVPLAMLRAELARIAEGTSRGPRRSVGEEFGASAVRGAIAVSQFNTLVVKGTRSELQVLGSCQPGPTATGALQVAATGIPAGQIAVFQMRNALQLNFNTSGTQGFARVLAGTEEWFAIYIPQSGPWPAYHRGTLTVPGSVTFDGADAKPFLAAPVTVTGTSGGTFLHQNGFQGGFGRIATFNLGGNGASTTIHGFADPLPGDRFVHGFTWTGPNVFGVVDRLQATTYSSEFGPLSVAAPVPVPAFSISLLAPQPAVRWRTSGAIPSEYQNGLVQASYSDGLGQVFLQSLPGYRAAIGTTTTYQLDIPDFAGTNYPGGALLGSITSGAVVMTGSNVTGKLVGGSKDYSATRFQPPPP